MEKIEKPQQSIDDIAAHCSDCGNCLFACPVYNVELIEPTAPRGKVNLIKALQDGRLQPNSRNKRYVSQCLLCGSCEHICTHGVEFVNMMIDYRTRAARGRKIPWFKKWVLFFYQSFLFKRAMPFVDLLSRTPIGRKLGIPRRRKSRKPLRHLYSPKPLQEQYDILLFPGCVLTYFYPRLIEKTVEYLQQKGFSVVIPKGLKCCGFPYLSQGWKEKMIALRDRNQEIFSRYRFKYLVVPCGTGVMTFRRYYSFIDREFEIVELTDFFHRYLPDAAVSETVFASTPGTATFHDPCHHLKTLGISAAPRHFMKKFAERFVDDTEPLCCGFGGIFSLGFPGTSKKILRRKETRLKDLGVDHVVTSCPGCYLHLREHLSLGEGKSHPHRERVKFFIDLFGDE